MEAETSFLIIPKINGRPKVLIWKSTQGVQSHFSGNEIGMSRSNFCGNDKIRPEALMWGKELLT